MLDDYYRQYGLVLMLTGAAIVVPLSMLMMSRMAQVFHIRPHKPSPVRSDIYECGMETIGGRWVQFNFRYYTYAILFVIFDVETVFMFPWAVIMDELALFGLIEMLVFLFILVLGYVYAWRKGALEWV